MFLYKECLKGSCFVSKYFDNSSKKSKKKWQYKQTCINEIKDIKLFSKNIYYIITNNSIDLTYK